MTQDEIIRMAQDVGLGTERWTTEEEFHDFLERFAWIITAHEREACASLRKEIPLVGLVNDEYESGFWDALELYEKSIQARSNK